MHNLSSLASTFRLPSKTKPRSGEFSIDTALNNTEWRERVLTDTFLQPHAAIGSGRE